MSDQHDTDSDERFSTDVDSASPTRYVGWSEMAARDAVSEAPPEANIILISHPEDRQLGRRWQLRAGALMEIGRGAACDVSLSETLSVSRHHARLRFAEGQVMLEDLGSTNGTYINDRQISGAAPLASGDRFQVGTVHFKFLQELDVEHAYYETLYQLAVRDGLTEIFNKRKFDEELEREFGRSSRHQRPLSLIVLDLDHFKVVNDTHGHLCGDHVLQEVAKTVSRHLRPEQTFARIGGEEFAILSPETDGEGTVRLAEKLRREIGASELEFAGIRLSVTCSFGVAGRRAEMSSATELLEAADRALYRAKGAGRDTVGIDETA